MERGVLPALSSSAGIQSMPRPAPPCSASARPGPGQVAADCSARSRRPSAAAVPRRGLGGQGLLGAARDCYRRRDDSPTTATAAARTGRRVPSRDCAAPLHARAATPPASARSPSRHHSRGPCHASADSVPARSFSSSQHYLPVARTSRLNFEGLGPASDQLQVSTSSRPVRRPPVTARRGSPQPGTSAAVVTAPSVPRLLRPCTTACHDRAGAVSPLSTSIRLPAEVG